MPPHQLPKRSDRIPWAITGEVPRRRHSRGLTHSVSRPARRRCQRFVSTTAIPSSIRASAWSAPGTAERLASTAVPEEPVDPATLHINVSPDLVNGTFADVVSVWHTPFGFTMDFAALDRPVEDEHGRQVVPANVVARMKIPANVIFQIARAIAENVRRYEDAYGAITPPPVDGSVVPPSPQREEEQENDDDGDAD